MNQRRREQYRQVRAHVQKEDGRLHAYGWSLPGTKTNTTGTPRTDRKSKSLDYHQIQNQNVCFIHMSICTLRNSAKSTSTCLLSTIGRS